MAHKRQTCDTCQYPVRTCICDLLVSLDGRINVWIVQDKHETKHAKNTAKLLALCYRSTHLVAAQDCVQLEACFDRCDPDHTVLLYPSTDAVAIESLSESTRALIQHVMIIDGTWPKAKKLLHQESRFARYTHISFATPPPSNYDIRKSPNERALSTLEAASYFLECVDGPQFSSIRQAFSGMIARQWSEQPLNHKHRYDTERDHG